MNIRIIGDVHGHTDKYLSIIKGVDYSVQLGDFNFNYECFKGVDLCHALIAGNHDNYDLVDTCPNYLGDFGLVQLGPFEFFFVRGAYSIDEDWRRKHQLITGQKVLWENEQLSAKQMEECLQAYKQIKPDIVLSHTCPSFVAKDVGSAGALKYFGKGEDFTTNTQLLLEHMWNAHQPKVWCHGHFHRNWWKQYDSTRFYCIGECDWLDFNEEWCVIGGN
jgi:hypothetical protein